MEAYFNKIYRFLFEPNVVFEEIKDSPRISQGLFTLIWVNIFVFSLKYVFTSDVLSVVAFFIKLLSTIISIVISWFLVGLFFEYIAKIFGRSGKLKSLLFLTSFAAIPWIFLAPLELLKNAGDVGYFFGVLLEVCVYFWTIYLYCKSLQVTYDLKFSRAVMLIFLPFIAMIFAFCWTIGFFAKLGYIFTV